MKRFMGCAAVAAATVCALSAVAFAAKDASMLGFTATGAHKERALEARFDAALDRNDIRNWIKTMASEPNDQAKLREPLRSHVLHLQECAAALRRFFG